MVAKNTNRDTSEGNKILDSQDLYIKWDTDLRVGEEAARITGYNEKKFLSKAISPEEAFKQMSPWLDECDYIVGHNFLGFDLYQSHFQLNYLTRDVLQTHY